ncbi:hypothetical protein AB0K60_20050 [Thermopolyspora sp. NPDC052614]|uniref:hypothetical protein n=1 Tax=Thermopolyspora sp. NPDC052614 TaxID=3155682 RepID=UPI003448E2E2
MAADLLGQLEGEPLWVVTGPDSKDDQDPSKALYVLEISGEGNAKLAKLVGNTWRDLTADIPVPEVGARGNALLRAECVRGEGRIDLASWADEQLITRLTDTEVDKAVGPPRFGLYVESLAADTRTSFDDFVRS